VAAFSVDEQEAEHIVVLVQCRTLDVGLRHYLRKAVAEVVLATAGVNCRVALVAHNALPRTSSGKLSRTRARQMYLASLSGGSRSSTTAIEPLRT
jgi:fatty-acyl-CoA synthase